MSLVRVPLKPCFEKSAMAWLSNWRRRSSEDKRERAAGGAVGEGIGTTGGVFTSKYSLNCSGKTVSRQPAALSSNRSIPAKSHARQQASANRRLESANDF